MAMPEKYQSEIEEILRQADEVLSKEPSKGAKRSKRSKGNTFKPFSLGAFSLKPSRIMIAGIALLLLALILNAAVPFTVAPLVWAGLTMFVVAYLLFFVRPASSGYEKRWRGRLVEEQHSLVDRVKRWLKL